MWRDHVHLGLPYQQPTGEWACPIEVRGLDKRVRADAHGESSLQALCLGLMLARSQLSHLIERGERLVFARARGNPLDAAVLDAIFGAR